MAPTMAALLAINNVSQRTLSVMTRRTGRVEFVLEQHSVSALVARRLDVRVLRTRGSIPGFVQESILGLAVARLKHRQHRRSTAAGGRGGRGCAHDVHLLAGGTRVRGRYFAVSGFVRHFTRRCAETLKRDLSGVGCNASSVCARKEWEVRVHPRGRSGRSELGLMSGDLPLM